MTSVGDYLGTFRFWQGLGQSYADAMRTGASASAILASAAKYLGLSTGWAVGLAVTAFCLWPTLAILFGYLVWKWRLVHAEMQRQMDVDPYKQQTVHLLREVNRRLANRAVVTHDELAAVERAACTATPHD